LNELRYHVIVTTHSDHGANDAGCPLAPDFQYPLPGRPELHKQDIMQLIRLVTIYRQYWEIHIGGDGTWVAQARTASGCRARFEAGTATHLEEMIRSK
jgi:hypothetical protein